MPDERPPWPRPYEELTAAMLELRRRFPNSCLLGASIVHPRHSIPAEHLRLLEDIHANRAVSIPSMARLLFKAGVCFFSASLEALLFFCLWARFRSPAPPASDIVMKTWVPGPAALSKPADFYYGTLFDHLKARGARPLLLAGDGRSDDGRLVSKFKSLLLNFEFVKTALNGADRRYFPEVLLVPVLAPLRAAFSQLTTAFRLRAFSASVNGGDSVLTRVSARAAEDVLRPYTTKNLMQARMAENAVRLCRPKAMMTFYEGQPWEKNFWAAAKRADPAVRLVGYQHTVIMAHSFALTRPVAVTNEIAAPDVVLCMGETTKKMMEPGHAALKTRFLVLGTHRRSAGEAVLRPPRPNVRTVLVLPEGILTEAVKIFDFAIELAALLPDHRFIFRCHPVLPFEKVEPHLKSGIGKAPTIEVSRDPQIQTDFDRSSCLIYRGSSAVLYAVLAGVKPFCWLDPAAPNIDPLFALRGWRETVVDLAQTAQRLRQFAQTAPDAVEHEWRTAAEEINRMAQPVDAAVVAAFVKEVL